MRRSTLLSLFGLVLLLAACGGSQPPEQPAPQPAPEPAPPPPPPPAPAPQPDNSAAERERLAREAMERTQRLTAELGQMINFDYDRADVRPDDIAKLDRKAAILAANPNVRLRISGHADERGSDEYNLALGSRRAAAAKRYLEGKGVDGARIEVVSFGEERPLAQGSDESAWAQNRRDEFEVTAGGANLVSPQ